jgi:multiple sugar transport system substrate-binding protein
MIKFRQWWVSLFLFLLILIYVTIFFLKNNSSHKEVTKIYFADRITAAHKKLIEKYNELNTGKVEVIPIDFPNFDFSTNERKEILARSLRGTGDGIDIFAVDPIWVQRFAKWCEPIDNYFTSDEINKIYKPALESCYFGGHLVAVPLDLVSGIIYYREDILKKLKNGDQIIDQLKNNITWDDFIKLKSKIGINNPFYIYPAADYEGLICSFMELLLSQNSNYFNEKGFVFNTPEAKRALQLLVDLVNKYHLTTPKVTEFTEVTSYEYFIKNDGLFIRGWQSYDKDFKEVPFDSIKEKHLMKAPLPHLSGCKPTSVFGGWNLMISKFSTKKSEAIDFMKFLISDDSQELFYRYGGYLPIVDWFYKDPEYLQKYPEITEMKKMLSIGKQRPANAEYTRYSKIMSYFFQLAIKNVISVKEALKRATNSIGVDKSMERER